MFAVIWCLPDNDVATVIENSKVTKWGEKAELQHMYIHIYPQSAPTVAQGGTVAQGPPCPYESVVEYTTPLRSLICGTNCISQQVPNKSP